MLLVAWLQRSFGTTWALAGVVIGGFADAHSTWPLSARFASRRDGCRASWRSSRSGSWSPPTRFPSSASRAREAGPISCAARAPGLSAAGRRLLDQLVDHRFAESRHERAHRQSVSRHRSWCRLAAGRAAGVRRALPAFRRAKFSTGWCSVRHRISCSRMFWRAHAAQARTVTARLFHRPACRPRIGCTTNCRMGVIESIENCRSTTPAAANTTIHIPGQQDWRNASCQPGRATAARKSSTDWQRLFKRSQMHFEPDSAQSPPAMAEHVAVLSGSRPVRRSGLPTFRDAAGLWNQYSWTGSGQPRRLARTPGAGAGLLQRATQRPGLRQAQRGASRNRVAGEEFQRGRDHAERGQPARTRRFHQGARTCTANSPFARGTGPSRHRRTHRRCTHRARSEMRRKDRNCVPDIVWFGEETQHMDEARRDHGPRPTRYWWWGPR